MADIVPRTVDPGSRWWVKIPPAAYPVTVDQLKEFARIDTDAEDTLLNTFIGAVTEATEKWLGRSLLGQTLVLAFNRWPESGVIQMPRPPFLDLVEARTLDQDGTGTAYTASNLVVYPDLVPAEIAQKSMAATVSDLRPMLGWEIEFRAGYGDAIEDVPASLRAGIMAWAAEFYENRILSDTPPKHVFNLLMLHKRIRF